MWFEFSVIDDCGIELGRYTVAEYQGYRYFVPPYPLVAWSAARQYQKHNSIPVDKKWTLELFLDGELVDAFWLSVTMKPEVSVVRRPVPF